MFNFVAGLSEPPPDAEVLAYHGVRSSGTRAGTEIRLQPSPALERSRRKIQFPEHRDIPRIRSQRREHQVDFDRGKPAIPLTIGPL
jgi:hypothetical protein